MKYLLSFFAICILCSFEVDAQSAQSKIRQFEAGIFEKGEDAEALDLIMSCNEAKSIFFKHKSIVMAAYDADLNEIERSQKFKKETSKSELVNSMKTDIELTTQAKQQYLKLHYPVYRQYFNQPKRKKNPKRLQKHMNQKVQAQPIGGGN